MSTSSSTAISGGATAADDSFRAQAEIISGEPFDSPSSSSIADITQSFPFSSGNPRIEETKGLMILYRDDVASLPVERKPLLCVLGVPNHMTYADFCQFCASFIQHILEMRIVRYDGIEDRYSILIGFDSQDSTDNFYKHFNGRRFSSLEAEVCRILFTVDVQYTGSIEHAQPPPASSAEQPTCPVCLERLDQDIGILTTICNHSFHCSCISNWTDSSCPVCRYCQQQPEKSTCSVCQTCENLWMCVICGFVGCGRYKEGHAIRHWRETEHCYSVELETRRVWDYAGDNYVHRLIQSKTDGKLVELNSHCLHANDGCGSFECADSGFSEALLNSRLEAIVNEYNELLATQLENQRLYYESVLNDVKEETDMEISIAVDKALKLKRQKMKAKLEQVNKEIEIMETLNENLSKNVETWKKKIDQVEQREEKAVKFKDDKIKDLEEELHRLMSSLDNEKSAEQLSIKEIKDGSVLPISVEGSLPSSSKVKKKKKRRN